MLVGTPVLVVDDNDTNRRVLDEILRGWGMRPTLAIGASEALRAIDESYRRGEPFPLVLTDAHMPQVDGFELVARIKQDPQQGSTVIMMLTSGDRPQDPERCRELGIAAYLVKPIKQSELLNAILEITGVGLADADERAAIEPPRPASRPLRVLLAEDSLVNQRLATAFLEKQGHAVTGVTNGREAVEASEAGGFDLILMDVQMPVMDGLEATAEIRAIEKQTQAHVPIIAMTAHALQGDRERCLDAGMDGYVAKPIRLEQLSEAIRLAVGDAPATVVDWEAALEAVGGDHQLLRVIVQSLFDYLPRRLVAMHEAAAAGDADRLGNAAHTLKGSVSFLGKVAVCDLAADLEQMADANDLDGAAHVLPNLERAMADLTAKMNQYLHGPPAAKDAENAAD
jgi:CheY-like chemotaxis protein